MTKNVKRLYGLEWYDGWLSSILHTDDGMFYAVCAVAIDWSCHRVRFAICQITKAKADFLTECYRSSGFSREFNKAWKDALMGGPVYLANAEPRAGKSIAIEESTPAERKLLQAYVLPLVERASSEDACRTWLNT